MFKKVFKLENPALTLPLALLVPYFLFLKNNWHMFSISQVLVSAAVFILFALVLLILAWGVKCFVLKFVPLLSLGRRQALLNVLLIAFSSGLFAIFIKSSLPSFSYIPNITYYYALLAFIVAILFLCFKRYQIFNGFLLILLCISAVATAGSMLIENRKEIKAINVKIELRQKPNVYLFVLESYHSLPILNEVYNVDTSELEGFLKNNNFIIYDNAYSNSPGTLPTFSDLLAMQPLNDFSRGNMDVLVPIRDLIGGGENNFVMKTFKQNGYFVEAQYFGAAAYYMFAQGPYLDKVDKDPEIWDSISPLVPRQDKWLRFFTTTKKDKPQTLEQAIQNALSSKDQLQPFFLLIKTDANHSPSDGTYSWEMAEDWVKAGSYRQMFLSSQVVLARAVQQIITNDPNAVIVLMGDHGAWRYRDFLSPRIDNDKEIDRLCLERNVTRQNLANDYFSIFMAIRMPGKNGEISHNLPMSPINLFWHVFAELSEDPSLLKHRSPSISKLNDFIMIRDGKLNEKWVEE